MGDQVEEDACRGPPRLGWGGLDDVVVALEPSAPPPSCGGGSIWPVAPAGGDGCHGQGREGLEGRMAAPCRWAEVTVVRVAVAEATNGGVRGVYWRRARWRYQVLERGGLKVGSAVDKAGRGGGGRRQRGRSEGRERRGGATVEPMSRRHRRRRRGRRREAAACYPRAGPRDAAARLGPQLSHRHRHPHPYTRPVAGSATSPCRQSRARWGGYAVGGVVRGRRAPPRADAALPS